MNLKKAVFLDRDGTLNFDSGYVYQKDAWHWLPYAETGLWFLQELGYLTVVVTNQSGVARGFYTEEDVKSLHDFANKDLYSCNGSSISAFYYCPHHPDYSETSCFCRKPLPGMLLQASRDLSIDLKESWMIGDKLSDIFAGLSAGCRCILVTGDTDENIDLSSLPHEVYVTNLFIQAVIHIYLTDLSVNFY